MSAPERAHLERLQRLYHGSGIARTLGLRMEVEDGLPIFRQPYDPRFDHILHDVHGGVIATMVDMAGWTLAAAQYPTWVVTTEFGLKLIDVAGRETLVARGRLLRAGRKLAVTTMEVATESGRLVAVGSGTYAVTSAPYPDAASG